MSGYRDDREIHNRMEISAVLNPSPPHSLTRSDAPTPETQPGSSADSPISIDSTDSTDSSVAAEDMCHICMIPYGVEGVDNEGRRTAIEIKTTLPGCLHDVGHVCIRKWFEENQDPSCPFCRQEKCGLCYDELIPEPIRPAFSHPLDAGSTLFTDPMHDVEVTSCGHRYHHFCLNNWRDNAGHTTCPNYSCGHRLTYDACGCFITSRLQNHWATPAFEPPIYGRCARCFMHEHLREQYSFIEQHSANMRALDLEEEEDTHAWTATLNPVGNDAVVGDSGLTPAEEARIELQLKSRRRDAARVTGTNLAAGAMQTIIQFRVSFRTGEMGW